MLRERMNNRSSVQAAHVATLGLLLLAAATTRPLTAHAAALPRARRATGAPLPQAARARALMGTILDVTAEASDTTRAGEAAAAACDEVARLEGVLSNWRDDSELARLNASAFERRVPCSADLFEVLDAALSIARETDGAFDPTVEPLTRAWDMRG